MRVYLADVDCTLQLCIYRDDVHMVVSASTSACRSSVSLGLVIKFGFVFKIQLRVVASLDCNPQTVARIIPKCLVYRHPDLVCGLPKHLAVI